jgi:hypothetical protein
MNDAHPEPSREEPPPSTLLKSHRALVSSTRGTSSALFLGSSFAFATGLLGWGGHVADVKYGTEPWLSVLGVFLGFLYGGVEVWKVSRMNLEEDASSEEKR